MDNQQIDITFFWTIMTAASISMLIGSAVVVAAAVRLWWLTYKPRKLVPPNTCSTRYCTTCGEWVPAVPLPLIVGWKSTGRQIAENDRAHKQAFEGYRCKCDRDSGEYGK